MTLPKIMPAMVAALVATSPAHAMRRSLNQEVCKEPVGELCPPFEDVIGMISPATENNGICFKGAGSRRDPRIVFKFTNLFTPPKESLNNVVVQEGNAGSCDSSDSGFEFANELSGGASIEAEARIADLSPECELTVSVFAQDEKYFMNSPNPETPAGCDSFLLEDETRGILGRCAQCNYEGFQVSLPRNICLQPVRVAKDALPSGPLNIRLDKSLKQEAAEICERGVIPPVVDDSACTRIEPDWIRLKTSFLRVDDTVTAEQITEFAASQEIPAETEAIGVFSGVCGLAEDLNQPLALIISFCGPPPTLDVPPPPSEPVEEAPVDTPDTAPVDPPAEDAPVDTVAAAALEEEATEVLGTALLA